MKTPIYVSSYVKGPVPFTPKCRQHIYRWAFRIRDPDICAALTRSCIDNCQGERTHYQLEAVEPAQLRVGNMLLIEGGQVVHADGIIRRGAATIDESAITGDSTYVLCESGGRDRVMRDSLVVSGTIIVEVTPRLGHALDWVGHANSAGCVISNHTHTESAARDNHVPPLIKNEENDRCAGK